MRGMLFKCYVNFIKKKPYVTNQRIKIKPRKPIKFENEMKININYISTKHYDRTNIIQWVWMFKRYTYVKGFIMRIFGIYINVRENNATEKLIAKARK